MTNMSIAGQTVQYVVKDQVATITMNRPAVLNAVNDQMVTELTQAFARAHTDAAVRAVILTGAGRAFAAGADMQELAANHTPELITDLIVNRYKPLLMQIATLPKTVIAAMRGPAAGMAASLALACDLRLMSEDAYLLLAFTNIGLMAAAGSTWFLGHLVGYARAFEIASEGERIPALQCQAWGLCNQVVPNDALADEALARAIKHAQRPTLAIGLTKLALQRAYAHTLDEQMVLEARWQQRTVAGHDHQEGVRAFFEKRKPRFIGA
jgi:2-(1,2-epoxy-1,2-dihydrophenyl)acetyl-CoA isomerase